MTVSALAIGIARVLAADDVVALLGQGGETKDVPSVFPVQIPKGAAVPAITINRIFERNDPDAGHICGLIFTCQAKTVQEIETVGQALIDAIDGDERFDFAGLVGITFNKGGSDITGHDPERGLMLRQIEFVVGI